MQRIEIGDFRIGKHFFQFVIDDRGEDEFADEPYLFDPVLFFQAQEKFFEIQLSRHIVLKAAHLADLGENLDCRAFEFVLYQGIIVRRLPAAQGDFALL